MNDKMIVLFPFHRVKQGSKVVIYGAGDIGQSFFWELKNSGYAQVTGWLDQSWAHETGLERPKIAADELKETEFDYIVIALASRKTALEVSESLSMQGIEIEKIIHDDYVIHYEPVNYRALYQKSRHQTGPAEAGSANRVIQVGFLAAGNIAGTIARTIREKCFNARLYAVASRQLDKAEGLKEQYGFEKAYGSYEDLLKDDKVEFVYISSPAAFHYEHILMALKAGKHVLCEKPFVVNYWQAETVIDEAVKRKLFLSDGLWTAYLPLVQDIKTIVQEGLIGTIHTVTADQHYNSLGNPRLMTYGLCGGAFLEMGFYLIHFSKLILGGDVQDIYTVCCKHETGIDLQDNIVLRYPDAMACLNCGMAAASARKGYAFGEKGYLQIEDANEYKVARAYLSSGELVREVRQESGYEYEIRACIKAIQNGFLETKERPHARILEDMKLADSIRRQMGVQYFSDREKTL